MSHTGVTFLQECSTLFAALTEEVLISFGPAAKSQLVVTPGKELLLTKSTAEILEARSGALKHPAVQWLVAEILKFHRRNGDGCATLLAVLSAALRHVTEQLSRRRIGRKVLAARLRSFLDEWPVARFVTVLNGNEAPERRLDVVQEDLKTLRELAFWSFGSHFTVEERNELATLIMGWIERSLDTYDYSTLRNVLCWQERDFEAMVIPSVVHAKSQVVEPGTFIVSRPSLSTARGKGIMEERVGVRFILLAVDFSGKALGDKKVAVSSAAEVLEVHYYNTRRIEQFIQKLARCGINLVLSTFTLPDPFLSIFKAHRIFAVQQLLQSQADDLAFKTGASLVHELSIEEYELVSRSQQADAVKEDRIGENKFVIIQGLNRVGGNLWLPQLVVTGISRIHATQAKRSLHNAIKVLKEAVILRPYLPVLTTCGGSKTENILAFALADVARRGKEQEDMCGYTIHSVLSSAYRHYGYCLVNPESRRSNRALRVPLMAQPSSGLEYQAGLRSNDLPRGWRFAKQPKVLESLALKINTFSLIVSLLGQLLPIDCVVRSKKIIPLNQR